MTLLENLYYGNIEPDEMAAKCDLALREEARRLEKELQSHLSEAGQKLLIRYSDAIGDVHCDTVKNHFIFGFRFGILLLLEVLKEPGDLIKP